jgi:hypothetical protein
MQAMAPSNGAVAASTSPWLDEPAHFKAGARRRSTPPEARTAARHSNWARAVRSASCRHRWSAFRAGPRFPLPFRLARKRDARQPAHAFATGCHKDRRRRFAQYELIRSPLSPIRTKTLTQKLGESTRRAVDGLLLRAALISDSSLERCCPSSFGECTAARRTSSGSLRPRMGSSTARLRQRSLPRATR